MNRGRMGIVLGIVGVVIAGIASTTFVWASTTLEQLNQAQEDKEQTEEQLEEQEGTIAGLEGEKDSLSVQLNTFNQELSEIAGNINALEESIADKKLEIEITQAELEEAIATEEYQYESMKKRIQFMYEQGSQAYADLILASDGFGDFLNKADYIEQLSEYENEQLELYQATRAAITEQEALLQLQMEELDSLYEEEVAEQGRFNSLVNSTQNSIYATAEEIAVAEQEALRLEAEIAEQENTITALRQQYEAELALSNLAANSAWRDISEVTFEEGDRYLLASIIYCEAGGESYAGQLAVGAVVINRLLSSKYPDTLTGVIYQNKQFSPVLSGRLAIAMANGSATSSCYQAADQAMEGITNVDNCLYFRTPIDGVTPAYVIGGHIFY
ncbi:MAG: cell wall hydrolase [Eubacteriales bacterium]